MKTELKWYHYVGIVGGWIYLVIFVLVILLMAFGVY